MRRETDSASIATRVRVSLAVLRRNVFRSCAALASAVPLDLRKMVIRVNLPRIHSRDSNRTHAWMVDDAWWSVDEEFILKNPNLHHPPPRSSTIR